MSVSQTTRGDMPSDARRGSDDEESHNGTRSSAYVVHPADVHPSMSEPAVRSTGMHGRPVQTGPICTTPGTYSCKVQCSLIHQKVFKATRVDIFSFNSLWGHLCLTW